MTWNELPPALQPHFWFGLQATPFTPWIGRTILIIMLALVLMGVVTYVLSALASRHVQGLDVTFPKLKRRWLRSIYGFGFTMGIFGWLLHWFTAQGIPVLSMRFWFFVWFVVCVIWIRWLVKDYRRILQQESAQSERASYEKWLPRSKR
ncbi:hypothetical protein FJZ48_03855 [Candidatus Uhrbacteria bacterium]|nr:hypothetical protein [Candidatus Uhrbacteria bacterium]